MADFEQAGATERLRRVAILRDMQRRLKRSPAEALGVEENAPGPTVRSAFMELTKQYHPAKFARLDEATVKLANEVFLQLREAYEALMARARSGAPDEPAKKPEPPRPGKPVDVTPRRLATNNEATAAARPPVSASSGAAINSSINSSIARPPTSSSSAGVASSGSAPPAGLRPASAANPAGTAAPRAHPLNAAANPSRATSRSSEGLGGSRGLPPGPTATRPDATPPSTGRAGGSSTSIGGGAGRPTASTSTSIRTSGSSSASGSASGSSSASGSVRPSVGDRSVRIPSSAAGSGKVGSGSGEPRGSFAGAREPAPKEVSKEMSRIRELIGRERWAEARDALQLILVRAPSDRANLAQLAYVRGREALELGNVTEARRELVRALAIEPTMEPAKVALQGISSPSSRR